MKLPTTMGADGAGIVDDVGDGVDSALIGREVMLYPGLDWGTDPALPDRNFGLLGMPGPGTIAEAICIRADRIASKPPTLDFAEAAAFPLAGLTAWRGLFVKGGLRPGQKLLVTGAGGGVAGFALQFAVAFGAEVYVTSSSPASIERAIAAGAESGINYREAGWGKEMARRSGGFDLVLDGAPGSGFSEYSRALAQGARVIIYGASAGAEFPVRSAELFLKNITLAGTNVGTLDEFHAMVQFIAAHNIKPAIDRRFTLDQAVDALAYLENGHAFGKVVITM